MNSPTKELFSNTVTSKVAIQPLETVWFVTGYTAPTKLHIIWTVRGI